MEQLLRDSNVEPTSDIIAAGLGVSYVTYTKFLDELEAHHGITLMDWRFYNDSKAWLSKGEYKWTTARGANKVKPIFWLSIWEGLFKVSFNFAYCAQEKLLNLPISPETKAVIEKTPPRGKAMQFIPVIFDVVNTGQLSDIYALAAFRKTGVR